MATRRAVANGNWSATGTWNGGVVPTAGDTVYSNGFIVTINQDIDIGGVNNPIVNAGSFVSGQWYQITTVGTTNFAGIGATSNTLGVIFLATGVGSGTGQAQALATLTTATNTAAGATGGGGQFNMSATYNMTCDLRAAATVCLNVTGATNMTLSGLRIIGGSTLGGHGLNYAGTGTVTVTSSTLSGGSSNGAAINNASTGSIVVSGSTLASGLTGQASAIINASTGNVSVSSSTVSAANVSAVALNNASTGTITVSGSTITAGNTNAHAISNVLTGTVTVSESTLTAGNSTTAYAILNTSAGTVTVTSSDIVASAFSSAIVGASITAVVNLSGNFFDHWQGMPAVYVAKWKLGTAPTLGQHRFAVAGTTDSYFTMYGADNGSFGNPIAANVRSGIVYGGGNLTGTCAVPAAGSVSLGVPVDATTGTAVLTAAAIRTELATELGRIDAAISSRLSPSGTLARVTLTDTATTLTNAPTVPTAAEIATAVEGSLLNEADGQAVLNAIVGAIGNQNLSEVSLVAAVRADLERTGGKLDNIPTTSAPSASSVAGAVRTELGVELGRLDASVSSRLAPSGTLATVTNLTNAPASVTPSDIWSHATRTLTTSSGPTAVQIRQEIDANSTKLDAAISSRMAASEATKLDGVKAKTDLLNTDRLSQVATTNIVGTLLAQSQS